MAGSSSTTRATDAGDARQLLDAVPSARRRLTGASAATIGAGVAQLAFLALVALATARVLDEGQGLDEVSALLVAAAVVAAARSGALALAGVLGQRGAALLTATVRARLVAELDPAGIDQDGDARTNEAVTVLDAAVDDLGPWARQYLPARRAAIAVPLVVVIAIAAIDPWTTLVLAFAGPMLVLLLALIGRRTAAASARRLDELTWLRSFFLDVVQGLTTLRSFGRAEEQAATIEAVSRQHGATTMSVLVTAFQTSLVMEWASVAATALVAVQIAFRLVAQDVTFAPALVVLVLTPEFFAPLRRLSVEYHAGTAGTAAAARIGAVPQPAPTERPDPAVAIHTGGDPVGLTVRGVTASRPDRAAPVLEGLDLDVAAGEIVAVTGPSGVGKSTLLAVLLGFVAPSAGEVRIGTVDLDAVTPDAWRRQIAWVPQRPHLFAGSVLDNVRLGDPGASDDEVRAALGAADALALVDELPDGWATRLGEHGVGLSGGQRQRLAIARALLVDRPVVLADEPTAHLDATSEAEVLAALQRLAAGRATVIVTHRPAVLAVADRVIELVDGRGARA